MKVNRIKPIIRLLCFLGLWIILLITLIDYIFFKTSFTENGLLLLVFIAIICLYGVILIDPKYYHLGFNSVVLAYTILCQFGFFIAYHFDKVNTVFRSSYAMQYMYLPEYHIALEISLIFIIVYVLATQFTSKALITDRVVVNSTNQTTKMSAYFTLNKGMQNATFCVGMILLLIGVVGMVFVYRHTGGVGYIARVRLLEQITWYGHLITVLSFAYPIILTNCTIKQSLIAALPYLIIVLIHLLIGNRGEVMYSLLSCVAIYSLKYRKISWKAIITGFVTLIIIIPIIRVARVEDSISQTSINLFSGISETLSEIGFQIAPTTYTIQLIKVGTPYRLGGTYLYGIMYFIVRKIPYVDAVDFNVLNNIKEMMPQDGLGYSQVAEAYYNFGILGGMVFFIILSKALILFEKVFMKADGYRKIFVVMVVIEIINLTRNSSGTIPIYLAYSILILLSVKFLEIIFHKISVKY